MRLERVSTIVSLVRRFVLASSMVAGCASVPPPGRPPAPTPAVVVADAPSEPEHAGTDTAPPAEPVLAEIREPDSVACRLRAGEWSFRELRLSADGERFASVIAAPVTLVVPAAEKPRALVAAFDGPAGIRLVARPADVNLYTKAPRALLGILTPQADAALDLASASPGALQVELDASPVLASPSPVREKVSCSDVVIVPSDFDARASITKRKNLPKRWVDRDGVSIAAEKGGPGVGTLAQGVEVGILETRGAESRVLAEEPRFVVSGWVASKDLTTSMMVGVGYGTGSGTYGAHTVGHLTLPSCVHELTLIGELGKERAIIGRLRAGTPYRLPSERPAAEADDPRKARDELVPVELPYSAWLQLVPGARLLLKRSELMTCSHS